MPSVPGPHRGIFREENAALRYLFDYGPDISELPIHPALLGCTPLELSTVKDVLFVSVDVDTYQGYEEISTDPHYHIGISIMDTRQLQNLQYASDLNDVLQWSSIINSYQFTIGRHRYTRKAARRFLFGTSEEICLSDVQAKFDGLVSKRTYILVTHGGHEDVKFLDNFDIVSNSTCILDTVKIAQFVLQLYYRYSLERLLEALQINYVNLHAAGNDAHFTLRSLLMLIVKDAEQSSTNPKADSSLLFSRLQAIAQAPFQVGETNMSDTVDQAASEPSRPKKLGVKAKGRLKKMRRLARREATRAGINAENGEHGDAIQTASLDGYDEIVRLLLEKGADINA